MSHTLLADIENGPFAPMIRAPFGCNLCWKYAFLLLDLDKLTRCMACQPCNGSAAQTFWSVIFFFRSVFCTVHKLED